MWAAGKFRLGWTPVGVGGMLSRRDGISVNVRGCSPAHKQTRLCPLVGVLVSLQAYVTPFTRMVPK